MGTSKAGSLHEKKLDDFKDEEVNDDNNGVPDNQLVPPSAVKYVNDNEGHPLKINRDNTMEVDSVKNSFFEN